MQISIIGYVRNNSEDTNPRASDKIMKELSSIEIDEKYAEALFRIEQFEDLYILFYFHRSSGYDLLTNTRSGDFRGLFATCSPRRPSLIGLTRVKLIERKGNILKVSGLDAINGSPVLDIKPVIIKTKISPV